MPKQKTLLELAADYLDLAKRARRLAGYVGEGDHERLLHYAKDLESEAAKLDDTLIQ